MITDSIRMTGLMDELAEVLDGDIDLYMIGGGAMMFLGSKASTKDIDLVVSGADAYNAVHRALEELGFESIRPGAGYSRMNLSDMFERSDGYRIDLFDTKVCSKLRLSDSMRSRSTLRYRNGHLRLFSCSGSDILIFKSITERDGDIDDCSRLIELNHVDWDVVLGETVEQVATGEDVWITWIADRLNVLSETMGVTIPILGDINRMADEYLAKWEKDLLEKAVSIRKRFRRTDSQEPSELLDPLRKAVDVVGDLAHEPVVAVRHRGPVLGGVDDPLLLQELQGVPHPVLGDARHLGQPYESDGLVLLHGLEYGDVPLEKLDVLAERPHWIPVLSHVTSYLRP